MTIIEVLYSALLLMGVGLIKRFRDSEWALFGQNFNRFPSCINKLLAVKAHVGLPSHLWHTCMPKMTWETTAYVTISLISLLL